MKTAPERAVYASLTLPATLEGPKVGARRWTRRCLVQSTFYRDGHSSERFLRWTEGWRLA